MSAATPAPGDRLLDWAARLITTATEESDRLSDPWCTEQQDWLSAYKATPREQPAPDVSSQPYSRCTWWSDPSDDFFGQCVTYAGHGGEHENEHGVRWAGDRWWYTARDAGPAPARADEFARVKVRLSALVASLDETVERGTHDEEFDQGAAHASAVTARQLREILNDTALGVTPEPAPELAAEAMREAASRELAEAMAESRRYRDALQQVAKHADHDSSTVRVIAKIARRALGTS